MSAPDLLPLLLADTIHAHPYLLGPTSFQLCGCGWLRDQRIGDRTLQEVHAEHLADVIATALRPGLAAVWRAGHDAGRDYQGDGWNADVHDPDIDNPYADLAPRAAE